MRVDGHGQLTEKNAACDAGDGDRCDGTDQVECLEGWSKGRAPCQSCTAKDTGNPSYVQVTCERGLASLCDTSDDCLADYLCYTTLDSPHGKCALPCGYQGCTRLLSGRPVGWLPPARLLLLPLSLPITHGQPRPRSRPSRARSSTIQELLRRKVTSPRGSPLVR